MRDSITEMITKINNANNEKQDTVDIPLSNINNAIVDILVDEGYIEKYEIIEEDKSKNIHITLKYDTDKCEKAINGIKRISKPGRRIYVSKKELMNEMNGPGITIISTHKGIVTNKQACKEQIGGEVLAIIW